MGLFVQAWKTTDEKKIGKAIKEISKMDDVNDLIIVIKGANLDEIKWGAVHKLLEDTDTYDYKDLVKVFNAASDTKIEEAIFEKLLNDTDKSNTETVSYILRHLKSDRLNSRFFESIDDENILLEIYLGSCGRYQLSAFLRINDPGMLKNIFREKKGIYWNKVEERLDDEEFFKKILKEFKGSDERRVCAVRGIRDQKMIEDIAFNEEDIAVRREAISRIEDFGLMERIVENAYERAADAAGPGCVPKEENCKFEFDCMDKMYCRKYDSKRLKYVNCRDGTDLIYVEQCIYGENNPYADFNNGVVVKWSSGNIYDYRLGYPNSKVVLTDEPLCGDEIFICPECYGVREGATLMLKECRCNSKLSAPRVHFKNLFDERCIS